MNILQEMWLHAEVAYKEPKDGDKLHEFIYTALIEYCAEIGFGFAIPENFSFYQNDTDFVYIVEYGDKIIISFRGTDNVEGWVSNLRTIKEIVCPNADEDDLHDGFNDAWKWIESYIADNEIVVSTVKPIYTTGHSRGGPLALLCAQSISLAQNNLLSCITFGAPRVGGKKFRDQYNRLPINTTRVVNGYDLIPGLPSRRVGFRHVGNKYWIKQPWYHRFFRKIRNHMSYGKSLFNRVEVYLG